MQHAQKASINARDLKFSVSLFTQINDPLKQPLKQHPDIINIRTTKQVILVGRGYDKIIHKKQNTFLQIKNSTDIPHKRGAHITHIAMIT